MPFEPLAIVGVISDDVGTPRNDGTPGSALYRVPIRLSRRLTPEESEFIVRTWNHPPQFSTMHRPGIARASDDIFTLDGTTIEEVRDYHAATLRLVVEKFNADLAPVIARREAQAEREAAEREQHRNNVAEVVHDIKFD